MNVSLPMNKKTGANTLLISIALVGCTLHGCSTADLTPKIHNYPVNFDYSYTLSNRNYSFAIYNTKHQLMTHPIRDLKLQMGIRKKDCNPISDIYIVSHGWNYTASEAVANYHKYIELADELLGISGQTKKITTTDKCPLSKKFQPFFIFVTWTSTSRPLSELSSGVLPLAVDNVVHPIAWTVDTFAFHIPSAWKQSLNAASNALGNVFPNRYLFKNWKTTGFGTEPHLNFLMDEDYSLGRDLPLSALIYELIKCKYPSVHEDNEWLSKCLLEEKSLKDVDIHLVGHSYGGKLVALAGIESLRRWMLVDKLKINRLDEDSTESQEEEHEEKLRLLGHHIESNIENFGLRMFLCAYIAGCADEGKAKDTIKATIDKEKREGKGKDFSYPITSLVLFNPALHPGELWYTPRDVFEFEKAPVSLLRLISRKGIVYSKHDTPNGSLFNIRELLLNTQVTQSFQQQVQTDWTYNPLRLAVDVPIGVAGSVVYGSLLYVGTTIYDLPLDFIHHVETNDACWNPDEVHPLGRPFYWLANTIDFFFPFLCGLHWDLDKLNIGPFRDEDKQGLFRLSRPALGKTGINKLAEGRKSNINLWGLDTFYDEKKALNYTPEQFCKFSYPITLEEIKEFPPPSIEPPDIRDSIYSFDASQVYNSFFSSHSDLGEREKVSCPEEERDPKEKRKYSFIFTYKFTKTDFWKDQALIHIP